MDRDEFESAHGELLEALIDAVEDEEDPTALPEWERLTAALEDSPELMSDDVTEVQFQSFRVDDLGAGRLNDEDLREEMGLDEEDEVGDEERVEFVRDVLREEIAGAEPESFDVHPHCRGLWLSAPDGREAVVGWSIPGEGFAGGGGVDWLGVFADEEAFRDSLRRRGFVTDPDDVDLIEDEDLLALWE